MSSTPTGYDYLKAKDYVKWIGLKPRDYIPILDSMFDKFVSSLPKPKKKK